jgi:hypothetical protein
MQAQKLVQVYPVFGKSKGCHPAQDVDDEQIFGYWR